MSESKAITGYVQACLELTGKVKRDAENPHFRSGYATLDAVLETILPACRAHKIVPLQEIIPSDGGVAVRTTIYHEDGDKLQLEPMPIPVDKNNAHGVVSASTYGRRVSLMAIFGLAPSDDDGNAAVDASPDSVLVKELIEKSRVAVDTNDWVMACQCDRSEGWLEAWGQIDNRRKKAIKELIKKHDEYRDSINKCAEKDDRDGTLQVWAELTDEGKKIIWGSLKSETQHYLRDIKEAA